ncbi:MAG: rRNA processing protein [Caeruleum heppii]|nr:MAG: rRNA processing protein [Caeruleum heppii]
MGASTKRKKEKKKDFQKPKLRLGRAAPKPQNHTDTSFRSKTIVLNPQKSLHTSAPGLVAQVERHISLLSSKTPSQVKDSLAALTNTLRAQRASSADSDGGKSMPLSAQTLIPPILPLLNSPHAPIHRLIPTLLSLLPAASTQLPPFIPDLILHLRLGMTSLSASVRDTAVEVLDWLLGIDEGTVGAEVVGVKGGWGRLLACFLRGFGWEDRGGKMIGEGQMRAKGSGWTNSDAAPLVMGRSSTVDAVKSASSLARHLRVFERFLLVALLPPRSRSSSHGAAASSTALPIHPLTTLPLPHLLLPSHTAPYTHLGLFAPPALSQATTSSSANAKDVDPTSSGRGTSISDAGAADAILATREERISWLRATGMEHVVRKGIAEFRTRGGDVGRVAGKVDETLQAALGNHAQFT